MRMVRILALLQPDGRNYAMAACSGMPAPPAISMRSRPWLFARRRALPARPSKLLSCSAALVWHARPILTVYGGSAIVFGMTLVSAAGMDYHDAEHLSYIVGMLVFLVVFLAAFAARNLLRVWLVLLGSGAVMTMAASLLQNQLV